MSMTFLFEQSNQSVHYQDEKGEEAEDKADAHENSLDVLGVLFVLLRVFDRIPQTIHVIPNRTLHPVVTIWSQNCFLVIPLSSMAAKTLIIERIVQPCHRNISIFVETSANLK